MTQMGSVDVDVYDFIKYMYLEVNIKARSLEHFAVFLHRTHANHLIVYSMLAKTQ